MIRENPSASYISSLRLSDFAVDTPNLRSEQRSDLQFVSVKIRLIRPIRVPLLNTKGGLVSALHFFFASLRLCGGYS